MQAWQALLEWRGELLARRRQRELEWLLLASLQPPLVRQVQQLRLRRPHHSREAGCA